MLREHDLTNKKTIFILCLVCFVIRLVFYRNLVAGFLLKPNLGSEAEQQINNSTISLQGVGGQVHPSTNGIRSYKMKVLIVTKLVVATVAYCHHSAAAVLKQILFSVIFRDVLRVCLWSV